MLVLVCVFVICGVFWLGCFVVFVVVWCVGYVIWLGWFIYCLGLWLGICFWGVLGEVCSVVVRV